MRKHMVRHAHTVHRHINRHALVWVAFLMYALIVAVQLQYPVDRAVPFAKLGSERVGYQSYDQIAVALNEYYMTARGTLRLDEQRQVSFAVADIGAQPRIDTTARELTDYPLWSRMVPFSFVFIRPHIVATDMIIEESQLDTFVDRQTAVLNRQPRDAGLTIKDGQLVATRDIPGSIVDANQLKQTLLSRQYGLVYTVVAVPHRDVPAAKSAAYFEQVKAQAEAVIALPVSIKVANDTIQPSAKDKAMWLKISENEQKQAVLGVNIENLDAYLKEIQAKYTTPAGQTQVSRVDGQETSRVEGEAGQTIDSETLKARIGAIITTGTNQPLTAAFVPVAPTVVINKKFSSTQAGLQAYVVEQASTRNVRISVQQIGGNGWVVGARDNETTVSASTYKLFVALALFDRMDRGEITWDTPILDTNTKGCFERMIVASTNACAEEWIRQFGRSGINNFIWSKGFSRGTDFNNPLANHTTAGDLARYFRGLHEGWLMSDWSRQYLLDALKRHHYTKGIPSGTSGSAHNKVGFLWDYSNDSAVVYHPRGTYVIAVMTKGLSFYAIADITREIEAIMYP
ncbi:MAG: serine hydrolase [Candidatus Saccharimonadales bacterium]